MNFMCGQNGSGKTAVLHGLQTCLGVSAKQSGRATASSDFIKDGAKYSKTAATIWNTGGDAYLPRKLGQHVTLVREMRRPREKTSVTSTWSILDAKGRKVGRGGVAPAAHVIVVPSICQERVSQKALGAAGGLPKERRGRPAQVPQRECSQPHRVPDPGPSVSHSEPALPCWQQGV